MQFTTITNLQADEAFLRYAELRQANPLWFQRVTTVTLGVVTLPVKVGTVAQQILFSVVEDLWPYNAIVG